MAVDGEIISRPSVHTYIMLHKPRGYVTTLSDEKGRKTVAQLVEDSPARVWPVGRLDMDSEGLLILTNDGEFANRLMHPKHNVNKTYLVTVEGYSEVSLEQLGQPITLDGYTISKPSVRLITADGKGRARLEVIIHEGRNRQVRRMCANAGMQVIRLVRTAEGGLSLGRLPCGKWRRLTDAEIRLLTR